MDRAIGFVRRNPRVLDALFAVMLFGAFSLVGALFDTHGENRGFTFWSYVLTGPPDRGPRTPSGARP